MSVLFAADLAEYVKENVASFTPSNIVPRIYNVYEAYLGDYPTDTYWTDWEGYYDNKIENLVEIYIGSRILRRVETLQDCCTEEFSIYDPAGAGTIYINVPRHTWLYNNITTTIRSTVTFLSGAKNPDNPSDNLFNNKHWPVKLEVPKFNVKLSDVINGLTKYSTFDFALHNEDGYFDNIEVTNFFNSPAYIRKTWKENPTADNFIQIRYGMVETIKIDDKKMTVSCADLFRTLEEPVCKIVKDVFTTAPKNQNENLPAIYGTATIDLIEIDDLTYVAGENITAVLNVYDKDGNELEKNFSNGIITTTQEAKYAIVTGYTNKKIGEIIIDIMDKKSNLSYIDSFWDRSETNKYIDNSPEINIVFTSGTVKNAIKDTLSNDMVFLIQKNNGKFTLREWGNIYNVFNVKNWMITQFPTKDYSEAQKNYLSSCIIQYGYNFFDKTYSATYLYNENEEEAEKNYSKLVRKEFKTYLTNETDAIALGEKLSNRFSTVRETIQIGLGHDTSEINLLDMVALELNINGRIFSKYDNWIVKEIDPAQDILVLENFVLPTPPPSMHTVLVLGSSNGTVIASESFAYTGDIITLAATPDEGYELEKIFAMQADGIYLEVTGSGNEWYFTMPDYFLVYVMADFKELPPTMYWINIPSFNYGSVIPNFDYAVAGTEITLTIIPDTDYKLQINSLVVTKSGGGTVTVSGSDNSWTFSMPADNVTVNATFIPVEVSYNINIAALTGGNIYPNYSSATEGTTITLNVSPNTNYILKYGTLVVTKSGGGTVTVSGSDNSWTFSMPADNVTVNATFIAEPKRFVAIASGSSAGAYSSNGINWSPMTMPVSANWSCVTYGNGMFIAFPHNYSSYNSTNGTTWSSGGGSTRALSVVSAAYSNGVFVAVSDDIDGFYSTDGIYFTSVSLGYSTYSTSYTSVAYGNGKFVAIAYGYARIAYSSNGINWTQATPIEINYLNSIAYGNGRFVAVGPSNGSVAYSSDGINWTIAKNLPQSTNNWIKVCFGNGRFVAIPDGGTIAAYSTDGINWSSATLPSNSWWNNVTYGNGMFVAVSGRSSVTSTAAAYSTNGTSWLPTTMPSSAAWGCVTYG
jgi:hypothetical protein